MKSAQNASHIQASFRCPICQAPMNVVELKSMVCLHNHTFDFTKTGYVNFLTQQLKTKYDKELFTSRKKLITESEFFTPLTKTITEMIQQHTSSESVCIVDMGCGEGSHLANICGALTDKTEVIGVGIDIAKEGVLAASKSYGEELWVVADIANAPFQDKQFDIILNILSPSNYAEFHRLMKDDGMVIKIVPQQNYLKELREFFYESEKQSYSNEDTVELFQSHFQNVQSKRISYSVSLDRTALESLLRMTPLTWSADEKQIQAFLENESSEITVDLEVLIGRK